MKKSGFKILPVIILLLPFISCSIKKQIKSDIQIAQDLIGDWEKVELPPKKSEIKIPNKFPIGMKLLEDSIEFYEGFFNSEFDSITGKRFNILVGNTTTFKVEDSAIYIKDPISDNWMYKWKYVRLVQDTLYLLTKNSIPIKYKKRIIRYSDTIEFDNIIYSNSGCYGACPIMDISVNRKGEVLYNGEGYVKVIGFRSGNLPKNLNERIFQKFWEAAPMSLKKSYSNYTTDDQLITTTFIKDGKIIKTIRDDGMETPKEMLWAYVLLSNVQSLTVLDTRLKVEPFYPNLRFYSFRMNNRILALEKSESFYLWTELHRSKITNKNFVPKYSISYTMNSRYVGPDLFYNEDKNIPDKIISDGQFYRFEFKTGQSCTYDLGYNFVNRNFDNKSFEAKNNINP